MENKAKSAYTRKEVAGIYGITIRTLWALINDNQSLSTELYQAGYKKFKRLYPIHIEIIEKYLG